MNKCRDCIHCDVCELNPFITAFSPDNEAYCGAFKNREEYAPVVHGRWIEKEYVDEPYGGYYLFHCSECGFPNARERNYCPNCGAKMDLEVE